MSRTTRTAREWWQPYKIYLIVMLTLVSTSNYLDRQAIPVLQELIKAELKLSDTQLGLLSGTIFALFYSAAGIPIARVAERANRAKLLAGVVALWSMMTALCGLAPNFLALALCRLGVGMGEGGCVPVSHSLISEAFARNQRGLAMAIVGFASPIAGILMPLMGALVAQLWGWRTAFFVIGLPGLALAAVVWRTIREPRLDREALTSGLEEPSTLAVDLKWLLGSKSFVLIFMAGSFTGLANTGMLFFLVSFMVRVHDLSLIEAGGVAGLNGVMGVIGTFLGGYLGDRYAGQTGRSYPIISGIGMAMGLVFYTAALFIGNWSVVLACILIANIGIDLKNGPAFATVQNIVPTRMRATAAAIYMFGATLIGTGFGPLLVGLLSDLFTQRAFESAGVFADLCPGGRAAEGASLSLVAACEQASATGLRLGMAVICLMYVGAVTFFFLTAHSLKPARDGPP